MTRALFGAALELPSTHWLPDATVVELLRSAVVNDGLVRQSLRRENLVRFVASDIHSLRYSRLRLSIGDSKHQPLTRY